MKKPEILASAGSMDELKRVIMAGADAVVIGESRWSMRLPGDFAIPDVKEASRFAAEHHANVYVSVNKLMDNEDAEALPDYLSELSQTGISAVLFGDPAVITAMRRLNLNLPLHWNAEMTATNYAAANYWASRGARRVVLARELNM